MHKNSSFVNAPLIPPFFAIIYAFSPPIRYALMIFMIQTRVLTYAAVLDDPIDLKNVNFALDKHFGYQRRPEVLA